VIADVDLVVPPARLSAWLEAQGLATGAPLRIDQLSGGSSNLTFRVRTGTHDWVLRRPPAIGVLPTAHDVVREHDIQRALAATTVPVPRMVAACADDTVIGAPFYLMERIDGSIYASVDAVAGLAPADARRVSLALADVLAGIHGVDPHAVGLGALARLEPFVDRQLRRWKGQWERSRQAPLPVLDAVFDELARRRPPPPPARIVHGDYNLANVMFSPVDAGEVAAVLDWELTAIGDALADLGALLAYWGEAGRILFARRGGHLPDANPGMATAAELVKRYEGATGAAAADLPFYEAMATAKLAVICAGSMHRMTDQSEQHRAETWQVVVSLAEVAAATLATPP
jgi:aminoglycoside phosphotransferase (APT) family kinase protein